METNGSQSDRSRQEDQLIQGTNSTPIQNDTNNNITPMPMQMAQMIQMTQTMNQEIFLQI